MKNLSLPVALTTLTLGVMGCGSNNVVETHDFSRDSKILGYLEAKTMVMEGDDIPNSPNGFSENVDYGEVSQCHHRVSIQTLSGNFNVISDLGTIVKPDGGQVGTCDRTTTAKQKTFSSTTVAISNVANNGECFDIIANYGTFVQEGRGKISPDGKTVTLELYFQSQSTNSNCAAGAVGSSGVTVATKAFTGNAQQVYRVQ